jgi:hypothetical protein
MAFITGKASPNFVSQSDANSWNIAASVASYTIFPQIKNLYYHNPVAICVVNDYRWFILTSTTSAEYAMPSFPAPGFESFDVSRLYPSSSAIRIDYSVVPYSYSNRIDVAQNGTKALISYNQTVMPLIVSSFNFDTPYSLGFVSRASGGNSWALLDHGKSGIYVTNTANMIFTNNTTHVHKYVANAYNLSSATFDSAISVGTTTTNDLSFSEDGSKLYTIGSGNDRIYQYNLSTNWNLASASLYGSFNVSAIDSNPRGLCLSLDGLYAYFLGRSNTRIYRLELGTAHDITTASYSSNFISLGISTGLETSVRLRSGGSYMYYNSGSSAIEIYMPTPYSLIGASKTGITTSLKRRSQYSYGLTFSHDGSHAYTGDGGRMTDKINLSTSWSLTTAAYQEVDESLLTIPSSRFNFSSGSAGCARYGDYGNNIFVVSSGDILQYNLATPYDVKTATYNTKVTGSFGGSDLYVSNNKIITYDGTTFKSHILTKSWNVASLVTDSSNNKVLSASCAFIPSDGSSIILGSGSKVIKYSMPDAYVPATSYYRSNSTGYFSDAVGSGTNAIGPNTGGYLNFSTDGTKMFSLYNGSIVRYYSLSTPWSIETSSFVGAYPSFGFTYNKMQIAYNGIDVYLSNGADIQHKRLPAPYDFSSFTSSDTLAGGHNSFYVNNQGNKLYKLNVAALTEYTLTSQWNVASAVATGNTYTFDSASSYADFSFSDTGQYLFYIYGSFTGLGSTIRKYNMDSSGNIGALTLVTTYTVQGFTNPFSSSTASFNMAFRPFGNEYYLSDYVSSSIYKLTV